ncbi:hypothetical protein MNV49_005368 [Pseudohyphozyma bogoriensis]|nr:hypothetical protein MNV49_005368 [Pseudohyphozyma bogoriensis]
MSTAHAVFCPGSELPSMLELRRSAIAGLGLFAPSTPTSSSPSSASACGSTTPLGLEAGTIVLAEPPLFLVPAHRTLSTSISSLSPEQKLRFYEMDNAWRNTGSEKSDDEGIWDTNAFGLADSTGASGFFANDEIFTSYLGKMDLLLPRHRRRVWLQDGWGFECCCAVCALPLREAEESDRRREEVRAIIKALGGGKAGKGRRAMVERAKVLLEKERLGGFEELLGHIETSDSDSCFDNRAERFKRGLGPLVPADFTKRGQRWAPRDVSARRLRARASLAPPPTKIITLSGYLAVYADAAKTTLLGYADADTTTDVTQGWYYLTTDTSTALKVSASVGTQSNLATSNDAGGYTSVGVATTSLDATGLTTEENGYWAITGSRRTVADSTPALATKSSSGYEVSFNGVQDKDNYDPYAYESDVWTVGADGSLSIEWVNPAGQTPGSVVAAPGTGIYAEEGFGLMFTTGEHSSPLIFPRLDPPSMPRPHLSSTFLSTLPSLLPRPTTSYLVPTLVSTTLGRGDLLPSIYTHFTAPLASSAEKKQVTLEMKEALFKSSILVGVPKVIEALLELKEVVQGKGDEWDEGFVRRELEERGPEQGRGGIEWVYQKDLDPILKNMEPGLRDVAWLSQNVTYKTFLVPYATRDKLHLDPLLGKDRALLSGALRLGLPRNEVEGLQTCVERICGELGVAGVGEGMIRVHEVDRQKEEVD